MRPKIDCGLECTTVRIMIHTYDNDVMLVMFVKLIIMVVMIVMIAMLLLMIPLAH